MSESTKVTFEGKEYTLTQDAYLDDFDIGVGLERWSAYTAIAKDESGNLYRVYWGLKHENDEDEDVPEDEMCDWDNPCKVEFFDSAEEDHDDEGDKEQA